MKKILLILSTISLPIILVGENNFDTNKSINSLSDMQQYNIEKDIDYSNKLINDGERKKNFDFCVKTINKMISTFGEDSIYTKTSYLLLARHYISYYMTKPAKELLSFVQETKENMSYENYATLTYPLLFLKAELYSSMNQYEKSYDIYQKLLDFFKKNNKSLDDKLTVLNRLTLVLAKMRNFHEAEKYGKMALGMHKIISKNKTNLDERVKTFRNYAKVYSEQDKYDYAIVTLEAAIKIYSKTETLLTHEMIYLFMDHAVNFYAINNWDGAIYASKRSIDLQKNIKNKDNLITVMNLRIIGLAEQQKNKKTEANIYFRRALKILETLDIPEFIKSDIQRSLKNDKLNRDRLNKNL